MMLFELAVLTAMVEISLGEQGCLGNCQWCTYEMCTKCTAGYSGQECSKCNTNCKNGACRLFGYCTNGCKVGWYGLACTLRCSDCTSGRCDGAGMACTYVEHCETGECKMGCEQNCIQFGTIKPVIINQEKDDTTLSTDTIVLIVILSIFVVVGCFCCYIKIQGNNLENGNSDVVHISHTPLYEQERNTLNSSCFTYAEDSDFVDSAVLMTLPLASVSYPSSASATLSLPTDVRPTRGDSPPPSYGQCIAPPPSYGQCIAPPPSYGSLFKQTFSPSRKCPSSQ